jgi:single-strand DNA-binding protein
MANETSITMVGNLTADPELRFLPNGTAMVKFTIASTPRTLDRQSGEWKDGDPLFMNCTAFRDIAENIAESLAKGTRVIVTGRLKLSRWEDKESGEKRSAYGLDVDEVGPSLRFAQAKVQRMNRSVKSDVFTPDAPQDDAWSIAAPAAAASAAA